MKTIGKYIIHLSLYLVSMVSVYAYNVVPPTDLLPEINEADPGNAIGSIIGWLIGITAVLTILSITWSGIQMILAVGEEEKMKKARHTMIYSFIGLILAGLAYPIVQFITNLNLDNF